MNIEHLEKKVESDTPLSSLEHYPDVKQHRASILQILADVGTPIFLCERSNLADRYRELDESLRRCWNRHQIAYSFKTNYLVAESCILQRLGAWAEVVSGDEYKLAKKLGFPGHSIVFNGPYKSDHDLRTAISDKAVLNINDHDELDRLLQIASGPEMPIEIGLRLSGTLPRLGHSRFGFSMENGEALTALEKVANAPWVDVSAVHSHLYGDSDDPDLYYQATTNVGKFLQQHLPDYRHRLKSIDLGSGFPAHILKPKSRQSWDPQPIDLYIRKLTDALRAFFPAGGPQPVLIVEPGRYLTGDGILLVTRVVHVKERDGKQVVNTDGSISMVPLTHYCPQVIRAYTSDLEKREGGVATIVYGATCRENDILYEGIFPRVLCGDYLIHFAVGAYNSSLSPDFIFKSPSMRLL